MTLHNIERCKKMINLTDDLHSALLISVASSPKNKKERQERLGDWTVQPINGSFSSQAGCKKGQYFDEGLGKCVSIARSCPDGFRFDGNAGECVPVSHTGAPPSHTPTDSSTESMGFFEKYIIPAVIGLVIWELIS